MCQNKLDLLFAHVWILAGSNQVHDCANTTVDGMQSTVSGKAGWEQYLNQIVSQVCEVFFFILDTDDAQVIDDFTSVVEETGGNREFAYDKLEDVEEVDMMQKALCTLFADQVDWLDGGILDHFLFVV